MLTRLRALLAAKIPIFPLVGLAFVGGLLITVLAQAEAPFSLFNDGDTRTAAQDQGRLILGWDGANYQVIASDATGNLQVDVLSGGGSAFIDNATFTPSTDFITMIGGYFDDTVTGDPTENDGAAGRIDSKRAFITRLEGETRGVSADVLTAGADNVANTTNGLWTFSVLVAQDVAGGNADRLGALTPSADNVVTTGVSLETISFLYGYESVGAVWDRVRIDTAGNLMVSLGTALDSTNDSVTEVGQFTDGSTGFTQETSKVSAGGFLFDDTAGTALAENDIAAARINLNRSVVNVLESAATRGLFTEVLTAGADDTANTTNGLFAYTALMAWDGTDLDRLTSFSEDATAVDFGDGTDDGLLGTMSIQYNYNGATFDAQTVAMATGAYTPGTNINVAATTSEVCTTDNVLTVGTVYVIQTEGSVFCELGADAAGITAAITDTPLYNPVQYRWLASSTSFDTLCCITSAGTIQVDLFPATF